MEVKIATMRLPEWRIVMCVCTEGQKLTYLEIAQLGKLLTTVVEATEVGLGLVMDDLVGANVASLSKSLSADFTLVWAFASVSTLVSLKERC